jgi:NAD(P)-dependent dehydrogenase (short-subunit alcohol dehydrogenase family)
MSMSDPRAQLQSRRMPAEFGERGSTRTVRHWLQLTSVVLLALLSLPVVGAVADPAVLADQPLGRVATPEEVAQVVSYCALDAPASMTGAIVDVNGASYLR